MSQMSKKNGRGSTETNNPVSGRGTESNETASQKGLKNERLQRLPLGKRNRDQSLGWNATTVVRAIVGVVVLVKGFQILSDWFTPQFEVVSPQDTARLRSIIYGGEPWLLNCDNSDSSRKEGGPKVHPTLMTAGPSLAPLVRLGTIDCSAKLPSGKTVSQRFSLPADCVGFVAANGERPKALTPWAYRKEENLRDFVQRAIQPTVRTITSRIAFQRACLMNPGPCVIVGRKHGLDYKTRQEFLPPILSAARTLRTMAVDTVKYRIELDNALIKTRLLPSGKRIRDPQGFVVVCIINIAEEKKQNLKDNSYIGRFYTGDFTDVNGLRSFFVDCANTKKATDAFPLLEYPPELSWRSAAQSSTSTQKETAATPPKEARQEKSSPSVKTEPEDEMNISNNQDAPNSQFDENADIEEIDLDDL